MATTVISPGFGPKKLVGILKLCPLQFSASLLQSKDARFYSQGPLWSSTQGNASCLRLDRDEAEQGIEQVKTQRHEVECLRIRAEHSRLRNNGGTGQHSHSVKMPAFKEFDDTGVGSSHL
jgi:hypothetical protein